MIMGQQKDLELLNKPDMEFEKYPEEDHAAGKQQCRDHYFGSSIFFGLWHQEYIISGLRYPEPEQQVFFLQFFRSRMDLK